MQKYDEIFTILASFDVDVRSMHLNIQMDLIDLQSRIGLKSVFEVHKHEFHRKYILKDKFPKLKKLTMCITAAFGTAYHRESFFPRINKNILAH